MILCVLLAVLFLSIAGAESSGLYSGDYEYALAEDGTATITRYTGASRELTIPESLDGHPVTAVGASAFRNNGSLIRVAFPKSIASIGEQAFYNCAGLSSLALAASLRTIGDLAFAYCESIQSVWIPQGVTSVGPDAFLGTAAGLRLFGREGSHAQEYAQANGIRFFTQNIAFPETEAAADTAAEAITQAVAEDAPPAEEPKKPVTTQYTVRFPHADRARSYTGEMVSGLPHG